MRYERNSGRFTSLILVVALVALVMGLGLPDRVDAAYMFGNYGNTSVSADGSAGRTRAATGTTPSTSNMRVVMVGHKANATGNFIMGLYDASGNLLVDFGSMTCSTTGSYAEYAVGTTYDLPSSTSLQIGHVVPPTGGVDPIYAASSSGDALSSPGYLATSYTAMPDPLPGLTGSSRYLCYYLVYTLYPTVSTNPSTVVNAGTGYNVTGNGFEGLDEFTSQGRSFNTTSEVWLTQNNSWSSPGTKVAQTITAWNNTSITFTGVSGGLSYGTVYLWVENSDGEHNASGIAVTLSNPSDPATTTGTLTTTGVTDTSVSLQATYTGDDSPNNNNNCSMQYKESSAGTWLDITNETKSEANKWWTGSISGIKPGTSYDFQATFTDTNGVSGTNPLTLTTSTTYTSLGVGSLSVGTVTDTSVLVNAPVDNASDTNNGATVQYQYNDGGGWTNFGSAVNAKSNQSMDITGLTPNTSYNFRVTWTDTDGVYDMSTKASLGNPYTTDGTLSQTTAFTSTTVGTLSRTAITATTIDLSAAFTGDTNTNNSVVFEWDTVPTSGGWLTTGVGSPVLGSGVWTVQITGLTALTNYQFRVTFTDVDGINGTNPATHTDTTPTACDAVVNDCSDCHTMPPAVGSHELTSHQGDSTRYACAVCHFNYSQMANVTSTTKWTLSHENGKMDIYTSNHVNSGIKGGYYLGYRNSSTLWEGKSPANSNNTCASTYCHGTSSPIWGASGTLTCTSCHNKPPTDVGSHAKHSQGYVGYKNNSNGSNYDYGCFKCHPEAQHGQGPATGTSAAYVVFSDISSPTPLGGTYNVGSLLGTDSGGKNVSAATCTNALYCHSDGNGGNAAVTPTWGTPITNCTSCHAGKTGITTGSHSQHVNQGNIGIFGCRDCHSATVSGDTTLSDRSKHVNGDKDVALLRGGSINGSNICSNTRCHNTGQKVDTTAPNSVDSPAWGGTLGCDGCHGAEGTSLIDGAPEYANGTTTTRETFNGHWVPGHVSTTADCNKCHSQTVDTSLNILGKHLNYTTNVVFALGGTYANKRCSGTDSSCHGAVTPRWGGSLACGDCHLDSGAIGVETDDWTYGNSTKATINNLEFTTAGHGRTSTSYPVTGNPAAGLVCTSCHDSGQQHGKATNPFRLISSATRHPSEPNTICLDCHDGVTAVEAANHDLAHVGQGTWTWTPKCVDCHDPHGDNGGMTSSWYNSAMIQSEPSTSASNTYGVPGTTTPTDFPYDRGASLTWSSFVDNSNPTPYNGICQICHTTASYFNRTTYTSGHNPGQPCTDCHTHPTGFQPAGACVDCHKTGGAGTNAGKRDSQLDFSMNSHHINATWANISKISCTACHAEGNYADGSIVSSLHKDGIVELKQWTGSFPTSGNNGTYNVVTFSNGTTSKANALCLSCHNATNGSATPFSDSGDSGTPGSYDVASGGTGAGSISDRYSATQTTPFSKFDPNRFNVVPQITKAYSPHGNAANNQRGVQTNAASVWSNDGGNVNVACLDCHNSHGSDALNGLSATQAGITYTSSVGGGAILKETSTYDPAPGTGTAGSSVSLSWSASADLCWDCHLGDGGASVPKTYADFNNSAPIAGYYDGTGRWTNADADDWTPTYAYKTAHTNNDLGDGTQKGGHFGASSALTNMPDTSHRINGRCTACHDPHGINPSKTNAQYMVPALKNTWLTSPYKEDRAPSEGTMEDGNTYGAAWTGDSSVTTQNHPARFSPRFDYCNPPGVGNGYGTGISGTNWGYGGSGTYGFFIDDNTFGTTVTNDTNGDGTITDNSLKRTTGVSAYYINSGLTGMPAAADMTSAGFAGLCINCHTQANLESISYSNGDTTVHPHYTVAGWTNTWDDLMKNTDANMHQMAYNGRSGSRIDCNFQRDSASPQLIPAGYRWSVDPGTGLSLTSSRSLTTATPPDNGGQTHIGTVQSGFHKFPCSKCHTAHTSKLPRLMKTNCLDVGTNTISPRHNPDSYSYPVCDTTGGAYKTYMTQCHNLLNTNTSSGGGWNVITGWTP